MIPQFENSRIYNGGTRQGTRPQCGYQGSKSEDVSSEGQHSDAGVANRRQRRDAKNADPGEGRHIDSQNSAKNGFNDQKNPCRAQDKESSLFFGPIGAFGGSHAPIIMFAAQNMLGRTDVESKTPPRMERRSHFRH